MNEPPRIPDTIPVLSNPQAVVFPGMLVPLAVRNERWIQAVDSVAASHKTLAFFYLAEQVEPLTAEALPLVGCAAQIVRLLRLPDGTVQVLLQGIERTRLLELVQVDPFPLGHVETVQETAEDSPELEGLVMNLRTQFQKLVESAPNMPEEMSIALANVDEPGGIADFVAANIDLSLADKQALLEELDVNERLRRATMMLSRELEVVEIGYE